MYKGGKKNKALVAIARDEWKLTAASKKAFSKRFATSSKGHSNHEWNNVADKLAGRMATSSGAALRTALGTRSPRQRTLM